MHRQISKEQGESAGKEYGVTFIEASAKTGENINSIFEKIGLQMLEENGKTEQPKPQDSIAKMQ